MRVLALAMCLVVFGPAAAGQAPAQPPAPAAAAPAAKETAPAPPPDFTYEIEARRDPFVSLINRGTEPRAAQARWRVPTGSLASWLTKSRSAASCRLATPGSR